MTDKYHKSVMPNEVIKFLNPKSKTILDCTLGDGGHTLLLLQNGARVIALDQDRQAIERTKERLSVFPELLANLTILKHNFADLDQALKEVGVKSVDGVLMDLGTSTMQLTTKDRGFSFREDHELDMRMDPENMAVKAKDLLNALSVSELTKIFYEFGGEINARKIATEIVARRKKRPLNTTLELADLVAQIKGQRGKFHPATRVFQALRMVVNAEKLVLSQALPKALDALTKDGTLVVISFHEGEDEIVKDFLTTAKNKNIINSFTEKPLTPSSEEIYQNQRSRSAKMRVATKK